MFVVNSALGCLLREHCNCALLFPDHVAVVFKFIFSHLPALSFAPTVFLHTYFLILHKNMFIRYLCSFLPQFL